MHQMDARTYFERDESFTRGHIPAHHAPSVHSMICVSMSIDEETEGKVKIFSVTIIA